jgi:hypothetical protein
MTAGAGENSGVDDEGVGAETTKPTECGRGPELKFEKLG